MKYKAKIKTQDGSLQTIEKQAKDKFDLYKQIKADGADVVSVTEESESKFSLSKMFPGGLFSKGIKTHDKIIFARNLGSMVDAGLSVSRALAVMERQATNKPTLKKVLQSLIANISQGKTMSDAMREWPKVFSDLFLSMVHAGEESGTMSNSLKMIALQMERSYNLQKKVKGALIYPAVILCAMVGIGVLMMIFVVPTLMKTFTDLKIALPASTRLILWVSELLQTQGLLVLIILVVIALLFSKFAKTDMGKKAIHMAVMNIPIIGGIIKEVNTARTARTLSSLLNAGVDVVNSVKITGEVLQNYYYKRVLVDASNLIKKGELMSKIFTAESKLYPVFFAEMMAVGEETGKISEMLKNVAEFYEEDVEQKTKDMSTVIEPFLMIIIAAAVGFFAVAMISPMYSLADVI